MAWFVEYDQYPFSDKRLKPERRRLKLDLPEDPAIREEALKEAKKLLKIFPLSNLELIWAELLP